MTTTQEITSELVVQTFEEKANDRAAEFDGKAADRAGIYRALTCEVTSENEVTATAPDGIRAEVEVVLDMVCDALGLEMEYVYQGGGTILAWWYHAGD